MKSWRIVKSFTAERMAALGRANSRRDPSVANKRINNFQTQLHYFQNTIIVKYAALSSRAPMTDCFRGSKDDAEELLVSVFTVAGGLLFALGMCTPSASCTPNPEKTGHAKGSAFLLF